MIGSGGSDGPPLGAARFRLGALRWWPGWKVC